MKIQTGFLAIPATSGLTAYTEVIDLTSGGGQLYGQTFGYFFQIVGDPGATGTSINVWWVGTAYPGQSSGLTGSGSAVTKGYAKLSAVDLVSSGTSVAGMTASGGGTYMGNFSPYVPFIKFGAVCAKSDVTTTGGVSWAVYQI